MTRLEGSEQTFAPGATLLDCEELSRSMQNCLQPIDRATASQQALPWLDFGTRADLYRLPAYTGERQSASALMSDEVEQKLDAPKIQPPSDNQVRPSVIRTKEDEALWESMNARHILGKDESATDLLCIRDEDKAKSKFGFFDSAAEGALEEFQKPPAEKVLIASSVDSNDAAKVVSDMARGGTLVPGTLLPEPWMLQLSSDFMGALGNLAMNVTATKFQEIFDAVKKAVVNPIEHPYRGHEMATLTLVPENSWKEAYKAFPDIQKIGGLTETQTTILMKAIVGNELTFYGPEDKGEDAVAGAGQGRFIAGLSIGFSQITPIGVRKMSAEFDKEVKEGNRSSNPLKKLAGLENSELAMEMLKPENIPILVGANISHNVRMFSRHKNEVVTNPLTLGYFYNPDMVYADSDKEHKMLLTKKEAQEKRIPYHPALPTEKVLNASEHAHNIAKWLQRLGD